MRELHLIRHAKSSWSNTSQHDFDRPLDARGCSDALRMAQVLARAVSTPVHLISSPAKRAWRTAIIFAQAFNLRETDIDAQPLIYEASAETLLALVNELRDIDSRVLIIGHNPGISALAGLLASASVMEIPTCGIVSIAFDCPRWQDLQPGDGRLLAYRHSKNAFGSEPPDATGSRKPRHGR